MSILPRRWDYQLEPDFAKNGINARWSDGHPAYWGTEDFSIPVGGPIRDGALSKDENFLAVVVNDGVKVYAVHDFSLREGFQVSGKQTTHLEWQPIQPDAHAYHLLCNLQNFDHRTGVQITLWELNNQGRRSESTPNLVMDGQLPAFSSQACSNSGTCVLVKTARYATETVTRHCLEVWSLINHERQLFIDAHFDGIMWAGYSPDDKVIASSSWDQTLKLWDADTGALLQTLGPTGGQNWTAAFSPDGKFIACGSGHWRQSLSVWRVDNGELVLATNDFPVLVRTLAWSHDSMRLALGAMHGALRIINIESRSTEQDWRLRVGQNRSGALSELEGIRWLEGGKKICFATGMDAGVEVYDIEENVKWRFMPTDEDTDQLNARYRSKTPMLWCSSRRLVACLNPDNKIRFWRLT